jgi:membrane protein insertase Oxa1/YidC/SpoIIIJ
MQTMQRVMRIMPIVFGFISWNFVSGLGLYFATSNVFRIGQQAVILRTAGRGGKDDGGGDNGKSKEPPDDPSDEPKAEGPSPNASKKRNRKRRK